MSPCSVQDGEETGKDRASIRSFDHSCYPAARIAAERAERRLGVSVCLPARNCAETVGEIVAVLCELREQGAIDEIVVVDAASADGTAEVAERAGAIVCQEAELMPAYGPVLGKGDAMWRALSVLEGELVCFLDADTLDFSAHFATGLLGPLICEPGVSFVKGFYRRPYAPGGSPHAPDAVSEPEGGGRVNHLMARPALQLFYPQLAAVRQPLAGEVAARRELLERLPFATGYGVEIAMLIDAWREVGLGRDRSGGPRGAPQPPPAAVRAHADGADRVGHHCRQARTGRPFDGAACGGGCAGRAGCTRAAGASCAG